MAGCGDYDLTALAVAQPAVTAAAATDGARVAVMATAARAAAVPTVPGR